MKEYVPYAPYMLAGAAALVAWGDLRARVSGLRKDVDGSASKELVEAQQQQLNRIEEKVDKLLLKE